nr:EOG090X00QS [Ilyocryptus agilis]
MRTFAKSHNTKIALEKKCQVTYKGNSANFFSPRCDAFIIEQNTEVVCQKNRDCFLGGLKTSHLAAVLTTFNISSKFNYVCEIASVYSKSNSTAAPCESLTDGQVKVTVPLPNEHAVRVAFNGRDFAENEAHCENCIGESGGGRCLCTYSMSGTIYPKFYNLSVLSMKARPLNKTAIYADRTSRLTHVIFYLPHRLFIPLKISITESRAHLMSVTNQSLCNFIEYYLPLQSVVQQPGAVGATVEGNNEKTLKLSHLSPGNYSFSITVNSSNSFGETLANLTVLSPVHLNRPPVAIIRPSSQTVHLPNNAAILDGLSSTDDAKIVSYKWELEVGPISYQFEPKSLDTLELKDLVAGNYTFRLTVTDEDGASNSTVANLVVIKETDYPPEANAGSPVVLFLPQNEITLNGNQSTDDHGIVSWEWTLIRDDSKTGTNEPVAAVDMQDTRTPYPHISHLDKGMYRFQLKVTDGAGQSSTAQVDVLVRPPPTTEPRVEAGSDAVITLPVNWVSLDGSKTVDDVGIQRWLWTQLQGPNDAVLLVNDRPQVNATGLTKGQYVFQLTAWDESGASGNDTVSVTVLQKENERPKANAGGDVSVSLPLKWVTLNGSASTDDLAVMSWLWTREPDSLAAGTVIANSDRTSMLMLTNLVPGKYIFRLTVTDAQGLSDHDIATLMIHPNPRELDVVTITLKSNPRVFKESDLNTIREQIALLLHQQGSNNINVNVDDVLIEPKSGYVVLQFFTTTKSDSGSSWRTLPGTEVASLLKRKLLNDMNLLSYPVLEVDTAICQNNCSGHGVCDQVTRRCICSSFWMENPIAVSRRGEYNCDWSLIYVAIIGILVMVFIALAVWSLVHLCRKGNLPCKSSCFTKKRRRLHRYSPLADPEVMRMSAKVSNSLLPSDLESETDSDVVYESNGKNHTNGRLESKKASEEITRA